LRSEINIPDSWSSEESITIIKNDILPPDADEVKEVERIIKI